MTDRMNKILTGERRSPQRCDPAPTTGALGSASRQAPEGLSLESHSRVYKPRSFYGGVTVTLKTILTTLIGTGIASGLISLPARASEDNLVGKTTKGELILSQNFDYSDYQVSRRHASNNTEPANNFKNIVGLTGLAIGTGVIGWQITRAYKPSLVNSIPANNNSASILDRVSPKLRRELLRLVHNRQTANRLLLRSCTSTKKLNN